MSDFTGIRVNNLGFFPGSPKIFTVLNPPSMDFEIQTIRTDVRWKTFFRGTMTMKEDGIAHGDFSAVTEPADYRILIGDPETPEHLYSEPFVIRENPWDPAMRMILDGIRWQRCGSPEGWGGCCHQDPVPLKHGTQDTGIRLDVRGGYHQSGDLRCWADGISGSFLAFLRAFPTLDQVWADHARLEEELAWCASYFLKIVSPGGMVYDCQFAPIGWGPRDYYDSPAPLSAHCNIGRLLAGMAHHFASSRPAFSARCLDSARKVFVFVEDPEHFSTAYVPPVPDLPPGTQGENFYRQDYRTSARGLAARCALALDLFLATGDIEFKTVAENLSLEITALQMTDGVSEGLFREADGKNMPGFGSCSYGMMLSGVSILTDLMQKLPDSPHFPVWKAVADRYAIRLLKMYREADRRYIPSIDVSVPLDLDPVPVHGSAIVTGVQASMFLLANGLCPDEAEKIAQSVLDFYLGENSRGLSYVNGIGWRHEAANIWGQFFPSTPPIPGGTNHILGGEYDMPGAAMLFLLMETLRLHYIRA